MEPHVQRMCDEQEQLNNRVLKLRAFIENNPIYKTLSTGEQLDMSLQLHAMELYNEVLTRRINRALGEPVGETPTPENNSDISW